MKQFATWHDRPMIMVALASGKRYAGNAAGMLQARDQMAGGHSVQASVRRASLEMFCWSPERAMPRYDVPYGQADPSQCWISPMSSSDINMTTLCMTARPSPDRRAAPTGPASGLPPSRSSTPRGQTPARHTAATPSLPGCTRLNHVSITGLLVLAATAREIKHA